MKAPFASRFTAYCSKKADSEHAKRSRRQFVKLSGREPLRSIETNSTIVHLEYSDAAGLGYDASGDVFVLLHGEVYDVPGEAAAFLANEFARVGMAMAAGLHGSCALLVVDRANDVVAIITDRVNSRRLFSCRWTDGVCITTSIASLPRDRFRLDPIGVGWYLSHGAVHAGRTVFQGVSVLERACIHRFDGRALAAMSYWSYRPGAAASNTSRRTLAAELREHMVSAVRRRVTTGADIFLSLSGGYDSRGICGILRNSLELRKVRCVCYVQGETKAQSDADVAQRTANVVGYSCNTLQCYQGDLIQILFDNARMGDFQCPFVYEIDAWKEFAEELGRLQQPVLLVGDECFGWSDFHLRNPFDALRAVEIHGFDCLG